MNPRVKSVVPRDDFSLEIVFLNDEKGVYDCNHLLDFGVFTELRRLSYFKKAKVLGDTVVWPHGQDICPDTLYLGSVKLHSKTAGPSRRYGRPSRRPGGGRKILDRRRGRK